MPIIAALPDRSYSAQTVNIYAVFLLRDAYLSTANAGTQLQPELRTVAPALVFLRHKIALWQGSLTNVSKYLLIVSSPKIHSTSASIFDQGKGVHFITISHTEAYAQRLSKTSTDRFLKKCFHCSP